MPVVDASGLLAELRARAGGWQARLPPGWPATTAAEARHCAVLHALDVACGAFALMALGIHVDLTCEAGADELGDELRKAKTMDDTTKAEADRDLHLGAACVELAAAVDQIELPARETQLLWQLAGEWGPRASVRLGEFVDPEPPLADVLRRIGEVFAPGAKPHAQHGGCVPEEIALAAVAQERAAAVAWVRPVNDALANDLERGEHATQRGGPRG